MRLPAVEGRLGLGVGLDLPWGAPSGFVHDGARGDTVADRVVRFLGEQAKGFSHLFVSFQPKNRSRLDLADYQAVYDDLFRRIPPFAVRALHQTTFNLGALEPYDRSRIVDFTNALIARYGLAWVNEDLGLWSIHGRPLPYPLPPYLTTAGLAAAVRNTDEVQRALLAPLLVEFPGFSEGTSFVIGSLHAYDFFTRVVEDTGSPATLDTGHLLSYQWLRGRRGEALFDELERLPLSSCFEIHLSGCEIQGERFFDYHHGVLMDEQLTLLSRLLPRCPRLQAITYEDPRFDAEGALTPAALPNLDRLRAIAAAWAG
ncbi:MAG: DUF692 family multinuclear iron-containing protein [Minicystis sp.]